jgi:hypothetical protein
LLLKASILFLKASREGEMNRVLFLVLRILRSLPQGLLGMLRNLETLTMHTKNRASCPREWVVKPSAGRDISIVNRRSYSASTATSSRNGQNLYEQTNEEDARTLAMFLDLLIKDAQANPSKLVPYTRQLDEELDDLLEGVVLD